MPGPPKEPLVLKLLKNNPGKQRLNIHEPQPQVSDEVPAPPSFVTGVAAAEWHSVAPELWALGLLTRLDTSMLAGYCVSVARWRAATDALAQMADLDEATSGLLVKNGDGDVRPNPLIKIAADAAKSMLAFAAAFGLTPAARAKLAGGYGPSPPHRFDGLIR